MLVVPFAASVAFAWTLSGLLPTVSTWPMAILRWLLIAVASTSVMVAFDRVTRRLLPLAVLLSLTLAFPDQAPSRFKIAMRIGTTLQLRNIVADARAGRIGETPAEAAEKLLELVGALSVHDRLTRGHSERVRGYAHMVGEELKITGAELDHLRWSALLHDIGKLLVSAEILNKPGKLTELEFEAIKQHPEFGRELVAPLVGWLGDAVRAVWEHHERWDGQGYPRGLAATEISLAGRIVAVVDAYDVMTSARSYKEPVSPVEARAELARCAGSHFDEAIVRAFLNVSLGRLRMAMGPLSWLTQLSFVPQALVTAGASGATAVTAVVGLAAGTLGVGLTEDGVLPTSRTVQETSGATIPVNAVNGQPRVAGSTGPGPDTGDGAADDGTGDGGVGLGDDAAGDDRLPGVDEPIGGGVSTTTTSSVPSDRLATPPAVTVPTGSSAPRSGTTTTSANSGPTDAPATTSGPTDPTPPPTTSAPDTGSATTAPAPTVPPTTAPPPPPPPPTAPPPTAPPTTAPPTTTTAPPTTMQDLTLFLTASASGAVVDVLPLATGVPAASGEPNHDAGRNGDPWLTLIPGDPPATGAQRFGWTATSPVRFHGTATASIWLTGSTALSNYAIQVQLRRCTASGCVTIENRGTSASGPILSILGVQLWTPATVNFGTIDEVLAAGESLELVVTATGSRDVWLAYDTQPTPSRLDFNST